MCFFACMYVCMYTNNQNNQKKTDAVVRYASMDQEIKTEHAEAHIIYVQNIQICVAANGGCVICANQMVLIALTENT